MSLTESQTREESKYRPNFNLISASEDHTKYYKEHIDRHDRESLTKQGQKQAELMGEEYSEVDADRIANGKSLDKSLDKYKALGEREKLEVDGVTYKLELIKHPKDRYDYDSQPTFSVKLTHPSTGEIKVMPNAIKFLSGYDQGPEASSEQQWYADVAGYGTGNGGGQSSTSSVNIDRNQREHLAELFSSKKHYQESYHKYQDSIVTFPKGTKAEEIKRVNESDSAGGGNKSFYAEDKVEKKKEKSSVDSTKEEGNEVKENQIDYSNEPDPIHEPESYHTFLQTIVDKLNDSKLIPSTLGKITNIKAKISNGDAFYNYSSPMVDYPKITIRGNYILKKPFKQSKEVAAHVATILHGEIITSDFTSNSLEVCLKLGKELNLPVFDVNTSNGKAYHYLPDGTKHELDDEGKIKKSEIEQHQDLQKARIASIYK